MLVQLGGLGGLWRWHEPAPVARRKFSDAPLHRAGRRLRIIAASGGGGSTSRHSDERAQHHGSPSRRGAPAGGVGERRVMGGPGTPRAVRLEQLDLEEESLMQSLGRLDARLARPRQGGGSERSGGAAESGRSARPSASIGGGGGGGGKVGGGVRAARNSHDEELAAGRYLARALRWPPDSSARQLNAAGASSSEGRPQPQPGYPFWGAAARRQSPITQEGRSRPMTRERRASRASFDGLGPPQPSYGGDGGGGGGRAAAMGLTHGEGRSGRRGHSRGGGGHGLSGRPRWRERMRAARHTTTTFLIVTYA